MKCWAIAICWITSCHNTPKFIQATHHHWRKHLAVTSLAEFHHHLSINNKKNRNQTNLKNGRLGHIENQKNILTMQFEWSLILTQSYWILQVFARFSRLKVCFLLIFLKSRIWSTKISASSNRSNTPPPKGGTANTHLGRGKNWTPPKKKATRGFKGLKPLQLAICKALPTFWAHEIPDTLTKFVPRLAEEKDVRPTKTLETWPWKTLKTKKQQQQQQRGQEKIRVPCLTPMPLRRKKHPRCFSQLWWKDKERQDHQVMSAETNQWRSHGIALIRLYHQHTIDQKDGTRQNAEDP